MIRNQTSKKVLFILPGLDAGGAERVLITLMNNVDRARFSPEFLSVRKDGLLRPLIADTVPVHTLDRSPSSFILPFLPSLLMALRKIKPDIIVSTMAHMNFGVLMLKPFLPHTKFVVREAITPSYFLQKYSRISPVITWLYRTLYKKADLVLSPTQKVFDEFSSLMSLSLDTAHVLKNPVDVKKMRAGIAIEPYAKDTKVRFVACGRLDHQKGFDSLIMAMKDQVAEHDWQLDILGEGSERERLEGLIAEHGLQGYIRLKGHVMMPHADIARADCLLMPSRFEGLPNVVLEALTCGTKVIATSTSGGIDEIVADCGDSAITVVDDMVAFISAMKEVRPMHKTSPAPSMIASCYHQNTVISKFNKLITFGE